MTATFYSNEEEEDGDDGNTLDINNITNNIIDQFTISKTKTN